MKNPTNSPFDPRQVTGALALIAAMTGPAATPAVAASSAGDAYTYQVVNGYNKEILGRVLYQVDRVDAKQITISVSPDKADAGAARTE